jgi:hypothetical protein
MSTVEQIDEPSANTVTETATSVAESATNVTETATSVATTESFSYVKDGIDLTTYALDFLCSENDYNTLINSYTTESPVSLFICVDGLVTCGGYYNANGEVEEYIRNNEPSERKFISISEWYDNYYGESVTINKILNNVFIGEDLVPLWKVLVDASNEDKAEEEFNNIKEDKEDNLISEPKNINLISSISITLSIFSFVLGIGLLTFLHIILDV